MSARAKTAADSAVVAAVDRAREAAVEEAGDFGVGDYLGCVTEDVRISTHLFECRHPGYVGWNWAVTMVRASRAKVVTVSEVVLLPGADSLLSPAWVPWEERLEPSDVTPGTLLPTPDNDPRLEPGFSVVDLDPDIEIAEASQIRALATEVGLGRTRVLSATGHDCAAERWAKGQGGADNPSTKQAPGICVDCGYFINLRGRLGSNFGVCANEYSPFDANVVTVDHGCGAHSDVVDDHRGVVLDEPIYDTISTDDVHW